MHARSSNVRGIEADAESPTLAEIDGSRGRGMNPGSGPLSIPCGAARALLILPAAKFEAAGVAYVAATLINREICW